MAILKLWGSTAVAPFPADALWGPDLVMWKSEMGRAVIDDFGSDDWTKIADSVRTRHGIDAGDLNKNSLFAGYRLMEAWEAGKWSPTLEKLRKAIIDFAAATRRPKEAEEEATAEGAA